jgi:hypothetical protein
VVEVEVHPAKVERNGQITRTDRELLSLQREAEDVFRRRNEATEADLDGVLTLVEGYDLGLVEHEPRRQDLDADEAARSSVVVDGVTPDDEVGTTVELTAIQVAGGPGGAERLTVVDTEAEGRNGVTTVEGVTGVTVGRQRVEAVASLDVDEVLTLGEVLRLVDVEVVAPQLVVVVGDTRATVTEVVRVTREIGAATVDVVDRDVAAGDVVAEVTAEALAVAGAARVAVLETTEGVPCFKTG